MQWQTHIYPVLGGYAQVKAFVCIMLSYAERRKGMIKKFSMPYKPLVLHFVGSVTVAKVKLMVLGKLIDRTGLHNLGPFKVSIHRRSK
jgi:hypothetical protein